MIREIKNNDMTEVNAQEVAVVDFNATWCGPCRMLGPVLEELSGELEGKAVFYGCDVDDNGDLAARFGVMSVPCVMIFKKGVKTAMQVGFRPKADYLNWIQSNL